MIKQKIDEASNLMGNLSEQHHMWQSEVSRSKMNLRTAFGDGMIAAASVSYFGAFDDQTRTKLLREWTQHFQHPEFVNIIPETLYPQYCNMFLEATPSMSSPLSKPSSPPDMPITSSSAMSAEQLSLPSAPATPRKYITYSIQKYEPMIEKKEFVYGKDVINEENNTDYDEMDDNMSNCCDNEPFLLVRSAFCLRGILSNYQELNDWKMNMNINDTRAIQNALLMNTSLLHHRTFWPLLVDPDRQAEAWVRYLHTNAPKRTTKPKEPGKNNFVFALEIFRYGCVGKKCTL